MKDYAAQNVPVSPVNIVPPTILLVDDIEVVLLFLTEVFMEAGFKVLPALNGFEARHLYNKHQSSIDVILSDVVMGGMDGCQLYEEITKHGGGTPIVLMSLFPLPEDFRKKHPDCKFILKSSDTDPLVEMMRSCLAPVEANKTTSSKSAAGSQ
jgi:DNA-binding NtrC family response regulator